MFGVMVSGGVLWIDRVPSTLAKPACWMEGVRNWGRLDFAFAGAALDRMGGFVFSN